MFVIIINYITYIYTRSCPIFNRVSWCFVHLILLPLYFGFTWCPDFFDPGARPNGQRKILLYRGVYRYIYVNIMQHQKIQLEHKKYIINIYICSKDMEKKNTASIFLNFFRVNDYSTQWPSDHRDVSLRFSFRSPGERRKRLQLPWKLPHNPILIQKSSHCNKTWSAGPQIFM